MVCVLWGMLASARCCTNLWTIGFIGLAQLMHFDYSVYVFAIYIYTIDHVRTFVYFAANDIELIEFKTSLSAFCD